MALQADRVVEPLEHSYPPLVEVLNSAMSCAVAGSVAYGLEAGERRQRRGRSGIAVRRPVKIDSWGVRDRIAIPQDSLGKSLLSVGY